MENKMHQDDFEQFLQDEVKQHRMYPSDHIWKNVRTELHGYKAWPALTFISLFIITALTISTLLSNHPHQPIIANVKTQTAQLATTPAPAVTAVVDRQDNSYFAQAAAEQITAATFARFNEVMEAETIQPFAVNKLRETTIQPVLLHQAPDNNRLSARINVIALAPEQPLQHSPELSAENALAEQSFTTNIATVENIQATDTKTAPAITGDQHASADDFLKDFGYTPSVSVTPRKNHRFGFQVYLTPSTSYRKLSDEKVKEVIQPAIAAARPSIPLSNSGADVNTVVRHRPAVGMEFGFALLYNMSDRLKFKTGLQLNVRQYYIETFQSLTNDLTSVSLINYRGVETVSFYSPYNNNTGYRKTQLDNKVYQVSIPVGIQWEMLRGKHFGVNTEASVQPTMTINNNTYLLSSDYKHYADGDQFIRKWNINTSMGLNLTYKSGSNSWQIGPQIRYQHLPTYSNAYPVKEYLMDYGVRVGFTKQLK